MEDPVFPRAPEIVHLRPGLAMLRKLILYVLDTSNVCVRITTAAIQTVLFAAMTPVPKRSGLQQ